MRWWATASHAVFLLVDVLAVVVYLLNDTTGAEAITTHNILVLDVFTLLVLVTSLPCCRGGNGAWWRTQTLRWVFAISFALVHLVFFGRHMFPVVTLPSWWYDRFAARGVPSNGAIDVAGDVWLHGFDVLRVYSIYYELRTEVHVALSKVHPTAFCTVLLATAAAYAFTWTRFVNAHAFYGVPVNLYFVPLFACAVLLVCMLTSIMLWLAVREPLPVEPFDQLTEDAEEEALVPIVRMSMETPDGGDVITQIGSVSTSGFSGHVEAMATTAWVTSGEVWSRLRQRFDVLWSFFALASIVNVIMCVCTYRSAPGVWAARAFLVLFVMPATYRWKGAGQNMVASAFLYVALALSVHYFVLLQLYWVLIQNDLWLVLPQPAVAGDYTDVARFLLTVGPLLDLAVVPLCAEALAVRGRHQRWWRTSNVEVWRAVAFVAAAFVAVVWSSIVLSNTDVANGAYTGSVVAGAVGVTSVYLFVSLP
jgi:hypothetical protein